MLIMSVFEISTYQQHQKEKGGGEGGSRKEKSECQNLQRCFLSSGPFFFFSFVAVIAATEAWHRRVPKYLKHAHADTQKKRKNNNAKMYLRVDCGRMDASSPPRPALTLQPVLLQFLFLTLLSLLFY
uniref:Uncharacterized protein n=1 Tax=Trypanosoma vivax (strain Y486) TaxID=1055687 RepID=G0TWV8_TRYVY|nr:hypothetical protein TVY486_0602370 [Trypanosoma vivax Y486]